MIHTSRRSLITGLVSFLAAPAVVRAASLMPVKALPAEPYKLRYLGYDIYFDDPNGQMVQLIKARIGDAEQVMQTWMTQRYYGDPQNAG